MKKKKKIKNKLQPQEGKQQQQKPETGSKQQEM